MKDKDIANKQDHIKLVLYNHFHNNKKNTPLLSLKGPWRFVII